MIEQKRYPFICAEHPKAPIKHEWIEDYIHRNGNPVCRDEIYKCSECGKRLAPSLAQASVVKG